MSKYGYRPDPPDPRDGRLPDLAKRVARRFYAAYFEIGSIVKYGKYKNHTGKIVAFSKDKWGNPTIEVEPIPKGRKQNKIIGLFKVWRADVKEKALAELNKQSATGNTMDLRKRVAFRFVKAEGIPIGRTFEFDTFKVHRYRDHFQITDLTNAGKRGKKVKVLVTGLGGGSQSAETLWLDEVAQALPNMTDYEHVKNYLRGLKQADPYVFMDEREIRGIDVNPGGTTEIKLKTNTGIEITATPLEFMLKSVAVFNGPKDTSFKQDTLYTPASKKDAAPFYNWLKANLSEANKLDITGFRKLWDSLGVRYNYH